MEQGDILADVFGNDEAKVEAAVIEVLSAFHLGSEQPKKAPLIKKII